MDRKELDRLYTILAGAPGREDLLKVMAALATYVADVRNELPAGDDSIATRQATAAILNNAIDTVRRIRNNSLQRPGSGGDPST